MLIEILREKTHLHTVAFKVILDSIANDTASSRRRTTGAVWNKGTRCLASSTRRGSGP